MRQQTTRRPGWGVVTTVAGLVLVASLVPVPGGPAGSGGGRVLFALAHVLGYGLLAGTLALAVRRTARPRWQATLAVFVAVVGYGAAIEGLQGLSSHRTFSHADIALNALGAVVGLTCAWLWDRASG